MNLKRESRATKNAESKYRMSDTLVNKILLCSTVIAAVSAIAEYVAQIFPVSMVVDGVSASFMAFLFFFREKFNTQLKLALLLLAGLVISLTAIVQNPYAPDGYMVMGGVIAVAFATWPLRQALLIPVLAVIALSLVTTAVKFELIFIAPFSAQAENSPSAWLIVAMCMGLMSVAIGGAIHELKSRLFRHINLLEDANERLGEYAYRDEGTGLANQRYLEQTIDDDLLECKTGCLLVINLQGLELYHAIHGQQEREDLFRKIAQVLKSSLPQNNVLAKLDGPQFAVWARDREDSDRIYNQVNNQVRMSIPLARFGLILNAAAVIAFRDGNTYRELMKNILVVVSMMPGSEFSGCLSFSSAMAIEIDARQALKVKIRNAIDNNGFYPVYQAKVQSGRHSITGFEGLARMSAVDSHDAPGPGLFIPILHEEGWMTEFGMIMLKHIVGDIPALVENFGRQIKVAANVSPPLFLSPEFISYLKELLIQSKIDPVHLVIEITEEVFAIDVDRIRRTCQELQTLGVQISLDDFGSGFSSLSFLRSMNFDEIKVDRSFIQSIDLDEKSFLLLSGICKLGQDLQCRVVVEGVETIDQLELVEKTSCDQIQGYFFSMPLAIENTIEKSRHCD